MNFDQLSYQLLEDKVVQEVLGLDKIESFAMDLAKKTIVSKGSGKAIGLLPKIKETSKELLNAYLFLNKEISTHHQTSASDWFLDNFHIIEDQLRSIKRDLPKNFYDELPKVAEGDYAGYPRVYAIAHTFVINSDSRLDLDSIKKFVKAYQNVTPLTIGELWAIAITLRISLILQLRPLVEKLIISHNKQADADAIADKLLELAVKPDTKQQDLITFLSDKIKEQKKIHRPMIVQLIQRLRDQDPGISNTFDWLEEFLNSCHTSSNEIVKIEHYRQATAQVTIGNIITSMRLISKIDWHDFFEDVSLVNHALLKDPSEAYVHMDRMTRDSYRKVIERISKRVRISELDVATRVIEFSTQADSTDKNASRKKHIGYYLIDEGVFEFERKLNYRSPLLEKIIRFIDEDPSFIYFGCLFLLMVLFISIILKMFIISDQTPLKLLGLIALVIIPISELSLNFLNYIVTLLRVPKRLPRMNTEKGIREKDTTMVVIPCLLPNSKTIHELVNNLEIQYLANQDSHIYFALLGDLCDAHSETTPQDEGLLSLAQQGIDQLNQHYNKSPRPRFYFFHRGRLFNPSEGKWICWERKRGKILEFNRLLRGDKNTSYIAENLDHDFFKHVKYVITLDADTQLPLQNARRLIGTITHPLNSPVFDEEKKRITVGYGILQPRVSVSIVSATKTRFANIFSGNTGIDPYTTSISDVYQDLFNEGTFTGKGLYEVDSFEKVLGERVPENRVLSHDLLEGSYTRVGLTTDIELIDDYPSNFEVFAKRLHRWTRGDWQISPWLFPYVRNAENKWVRNNLPLVARWKILDNLRRSLLSPVTLLWLMLAWTILPGNPSDWTITIILTLSFSVYAPSFTDLFKIGENTWRGHLKICLHEMKIRLYQVFLMLIFLPSMAIEQIDAILRALYRMLISKKKLLEWVTFSQTQNQTNNKSGWTEILSAGPIFAAFTIIVLLWTESQSFLPASPFIIAWALAPLASLWCKQKIRPRRAPLTTGEIHQFRRYARMTWHFFESFSHEKNNWLAPDNFQEDPKPVVAHRTSPTNIGLQFLSTISAYDLGYTGIIEMMENLEHTMSTVIKLEKLKGHLFNWYDTLSLNPLYPHYVSSVDSGNFAGHLITLRQACLKFKNMNNNTNPLAVTGLKDTLMVVEEKLNLMSGFNQELKQIIKDLLRETGTHTERKAWREAISKVQQINQHLGSIISSDVNMDDHLRSDNFHSWINCLNNQILSHLRDEEEDQSEVPARFEKIAEACEDLYLNMDFAFLFNEERKIFSIGFNATESRLDDSYYDLLASESRLTSFFAIAKGDVSNEHWFRLGRQVTNVVGGRVLVSWSASMFEYLMPLLVMRRFDVTLLDQTYEAVVLRQIEYGRQRNIPWGVSEAGYNARDLNFNYQYGPFGVPGLGLKRGLRDELVISPYSSMLAAMVFPREALANLVQLEKIKMLGSYGFYESIDYTGLRVPKNQQGVVLRSYMAHHQGMSLVAMNNLINKSIMQKRFHAEPRIKAVELLLQERIPANAEVSKPRAEETHIESFAKIAKDHSTRIYIDPNLSLPRTQVLSNGNYSVMMTTAGSGFSKCEGRMVTRWREDSSQDHWGQYIYLQNIKSQKIWSAGFSPIGTKYKEYEAHFAEDKIEIFREDSDIRTHTEVIVSSEDNVEMRRVSITNNSNETVEIEVTSYMEVVLARANDDAAHPAFSNLFIQTEFLHETQSLLAHRRPRSEKDPEIWGLHLMVLEGEAVGPIQYETDRFRFLGRGRTTKGPIVLTNEIELSNTVGAVLDPIFSLRQRIKIRPHQSAKLTFSTGLVYSREEAIRVTGKYHDPHIFLRQVNLGWVKAQMGLRHLNISHEKAHLFQRLAGRVLYLAPYLRAQTQELMANRKSQSSLWSYGISGDMPIVLTQVQNEKDMDMVRELLHAHEYLRLKDLKFDLVILNEHSTSYFQHVHDELMRQIKISGQHFLLNKPGGIFIHQADQIPHEDLVLIKSVSRIILLANKGTLGDQLRRRPHEYELPPRFVPTVQKRDFARAPFQLPELKLFNGLGGFTPDGREYVVVLKADQCTPAPWINVVANQKDFGFIVSESGQGYTWSVNSRENRLSNWSNDPVSDPTSEAIYLRDEESGAYWTPTPLPIREHGPYVVRHGHGQSEFQLESHGISHKMTMFVPLEDSIKIIRLRLKNNHQKTRRLSVTSYIDWVLGFSKEQTAQTLTSNWDEESNSLWARNYYNNEFANRIAYMAMSGKERTITSDRKEFIGRNGSLARPSALDRKNLSGKVGCGFDQCGAIQSPFNLAPGEEKEIIVLIGQAESEEEIRKTIQKYLSSDNVSEALKAVHDFWEEVLGSIIIKTPDPSMDLLVNRWLLYQTLACRIWARSAFYQSGGAYGFRDQLQDVMAMVYSHPEITRAQIKLAASRQFPEGDVQHWWHPPTGRGVRTRFSDDLLWLPFVVSFYIRVTGDNSILDESVPFIETPPLEEGHDETYTQPVISQKVASVYDHCIRVLDRSLKVGDHGLPLMGSGDWNDGMNRVGHLGKGESVWLGWFLIRILKDFTPICQSKNDGHRAQRFSEHIESLKNAIEANAWDGEWYLRAYYDNGDKLGSRDNKECNIDAIAQSWSLLSGAGDVSRSMQALASVDKHLIDRENKIIKLFTPPFDKTEADPGYIKGYLPGVRENGGQYTHAAIWTMMAYAALDDGESAVELFSMINPVNRSSSHTGCFKYKVEPYVITADIYGVAPHVGRGGWSWYTGSASWMYRAAIESILGLKIEKDRLTLKPCVPKEWDKFEITYRKYKTKFHITVLNNQNISSIEMDQQQIEGDWIPLIYDGIDHMILIKLGH